MAGRTPDEIMRDFDAGCRGLADIDMLSVLWEVIEDERASYRLAMETVGVAPAIVDEIQDTVRDYMVNHYSNEEED